MKNKIASFLRKNKLFPDTGELILGVSGGRDSMALLHVLSSLGYTLLVAHVNYGLRGAESDADQNFVETFCSQHQIACSILHASNELGNQEVRANLQALAREIRYRWFQDLLLERSAKGILTAHHLDDQAETITYHFVRGTGIKGLRGIAPQDDHIYRPMIYCSRADINEYIDLHKIPYIDDSSNKKMLYRRNYIRHHIIPEIVKLNPNFLENIRKQQMIYADLYLLAVSQSELFKQSIFQDDLGFYSLDLKEKVEMPGLLTHLWSIFEPFDFNFYQLEGLLAKLREGKSGVVFKSKFAILCLHGQKITWIESHKYETLKGSLFPFCPATLSQPNTVNSHGPYRIRILDPQTDVEGTREEIIHLPLNLLDETITLRTWRKGDRFKPLKLKGKEKLLSDLFQECRIDVLRRRCLPLIAKEKEILWVSHLGSKYFENNCDDPISLVLTIHKSNQQCSSENDDMHNPEIFI